MAPIIQVSDETLKTLNPKVYTLRNDLEKSVSQIADLDTSNWIRLQKDFTKGKYCLDVDPARISYNPAVEKIGKELGINYKNTSKDSLDREFIGNNNWYDFLKLNLALGNNTLSTKQFSDFLKLLYLGSQEKIKVYNAKGKQIDSKLCEKYLMDIVEAKSPWRAEWLDADFKVTDNQLYINYNHKLDEKGILVPQNSEILNKNTLMENKTPGISLENWLETSTKQGLPKKIIKKGDLYYWAPGTDNNSVARFYAFSVRANLDCYWDPSDGDSNLGERAAKSCESKVLLA